MENSQDVKVNHEDSFNIVSSHYSQSSIGSAEESFVVLWKDGDYKSIKEVSSESASTKSVEDKSLIKQTQMELERLSFANELTQPENGLLFNTGGLSGENVKEAVKNGQTDQLPKLSPTQNEIDTGIISIPTITNHLTPEEIEQKVSEIVEENIRLKDTILGNNNTMKLQYERIVKWQSDVQKVHEAHREKLIEAKDFIDRLKKENFNMLRELEQVKGSKKDLEEEINVLRQTLTESSSTSNIKEEEMREMELKMKNLTTENAEDKINSILAKSRIEECEKEIDSLQKASHTSLRELEEAQAKLKQTHDLHDVKVKAFNETILSLSTQLAATSQPQAVTTTRAELYAQIDNLNKEIFELRAKLNGGRGHSDEIFALKAQLELYKIDFETERSAKEAVKVEKGKVSEDVKKLQAQNQKLQEQIKTIRDNYIIVPRPREGQSATSSRPSITPDDPCFLQ